MVICWFMSNKPFRLSLSFSSCFIRERDVSYSLFWFFINSSIFYSRFGLFSLICSFISPRFSSIKSDFTFHSFLLKFTWLYRPRLSRSKYSILSKNAFVSVVPGPCSLSVFGIMFVRSSSLPDDDESGFFGFSGSAFFSVPPP